MASDYAAGATIYKKFTTRDANVPATLSGSPVVKVYKDDSTTTEENTGLTLTVDFDSITGFNHITIDTSADATFYANGHHFAVTITTGTVGGSSVVGETVWEFDLVAAPATAPTAAAIATAIFTDLLASSDFSTSSSFGKLIKDNLDAVVSAIKAKTDLIPPSPASTTNITAGTITTTTNLTNLPSIPNNWLTVAGIAAGALTSVWDEVNTGATHNVTNSTGKQLRSITAGASEVIYPLSGTVNLTAATSTTATLDALASNGSQAYQWNVLNINTGMGAGQSRIITNYTTGRVATVTPAFTTTPNATSTFDITPTASVQVVSYVAGQDPATLTWAAVTRTITGGTISAYTGNTPQTGDAFARLGAPAGANVSADIAAVKTDIDAGANVNAASVRTALGMASANLDTQITALPTAAGVSDKLLGRNIAGGSDGGRTVAEAMAFLRNRWVVSAGILTIYATNDSDPLWTATVTTMAGNPITAVDPA